MSVCRAVCMGLFDNAKKGDKFIKKDGNVVEYLQHVSIKDGGRVFFVFDKDKSNCYFVDEKGVYSILVWTNLWRNFGIVW